jgi:hypothetical protein
VLFLPSKENLDGLFGHVLGNGLNYPRSPKGLVTICECASCKVLTRCTNDLDSRLVVMERKIVRIPPNDPKKVKHR